MILPELADLNRRDSADGVDQQVVGAVIDHECGILLLKRPVDDFRGGTWELPSGKVEAADTDLIAALRREVEEETGLTLDEVTAYLGAFDYTSASGRHTRQHTWAATVTKPEPVRLTEHDDHAWTTPANQDEHPVSAEVEHVIAEHRRSVGVPRRNRPTHQA